MPFVALAKKGCRISKFVQLIQAGATNGTAIKSNMFYVYIIQSIDFPKQFYTGFSEGIDERLDDHNKGKSTHTNKFKPWRMIYYCAFDDNLTIRRRLWISRST